MDLKEFRNSLGKIIADPNNGPIPKTLILGRIYHSLPVNPPEEHMDDIAIRKSLLETSIKDLFRHINN